MYVTAYQTPLIRPGDDLFQVISSSIPSIAERSVLVVASKIVSTVENRFVEKKTSEKQEKYDLAKREAELYLDPHSSKYNLMLTIKRNWMFMYAGIDESNADNQFILWPKDPQKSVNQLWQFLREYYHLKEVGVTMSDSTSIPLNWGVITHAIAYCGFHPLKSYIGKPDLFGREMKMEQVNMMQSVTAAAGLEMGEGDERTPLAVVSDIRDIRFQDHTPTEKELSSLKIELEDDAFGPLLTHVNWEKGGAND